jgi:hypothetical protein
MSSYVQSDDDDYELAFNYVQANTNLAMMLNYVQSDGNLLVMFDYVQSDGNLV